SVFYRLPRFPLFPYTRSSDLARRIVRVQRREHEVARERGFDRDVGGLRVANFADEDHVRVLAQNRAQSSGERETALRIHRHLIRSEEHTSELQSLAYLVCRLL